MEMEEVREEVRKAIKRMNDRERERIGISPASQRYADDVTLQNLIDLRRQVAQLERERENALDVVQRERERRTRVREAIINLFASARRPLDEKAPEGVEVVVKVLASDFDRIVELFKMGEI